MSELSEEVQPKFLVDGMLGSLARKLRILGFDTLYDPKSEDDALRSSARTDRRILLTGDFELYKSAKRSYIDTILIDSSSERDRLFEVLQKLGTTKIRTDQMVSRCSQCNGVLYDTGKIGRHGSVFSCRTCGKSYWKGSHWDKLNALFSDVNLMLLQEHEKKIRKLKHESSESF